jgi:excisionase family DNA binding protein
LKRNATETSKGGHPDGVYDLTAGDVARLLSVDLKTIHNWVNQGHLFGRRTEGRHLRFHRVEIVRFLRRSGHPVPESIGRPPPRVLLCRRRPLDNLSLRGVIQSVSHGLFAPALEVATGYYEVFVLEIDSHDLEHTCELLAALRGRPTTQALSIVGLSRSAERRRHFVDQGGDVGLAAGNLADIVHTAKWLTGAVATPPTRAITR